MTDSDQFRDQPGSNNPLAVVYNDNPTTFNEGFDPDSDKDWSTFNRENYKDEEPPGQVEAPIELVVDAAVAVDPSEFEI